MNSDHYDYIICGAGCSGLSLAIRLTDPVFSSKRIIILDKSKKDSNDRTWSFWTKEGNDPYQSIYKKTWDQIAFYAPDHEQIVTPGTYRYHTISGLDFYNYCLGIIKKAPNITFRQESILEIKESASGVDVCTTDKTYSADYVFDSIVRAFPENNHLFVWQHFLGWEVELKEGSFDSSTATFMDFRIDQGEETRFVYVLPFDNKTALVEATLFSMDILEEAEYEYILKPYMKKYFSDKYIIRHREIGKIPMTTAPFSRGSKHIIPIGTNNATVKPSSGYAFTRIQRESDLLIEKIKKDKISKVRTQSRFLAYDKTLLNVLLTKKESGQRIFSMMFKHNRMEAILNFLDETSSIADEIRIFKTLPFWPFLRAFIKENVFSTDKTG